MIMIPGVPGFSPLAVAVGLVAGGLVAAAAPAGAGPVWSLLSTPDPSGSSGVTLSARGVPDHHELLRGRPVRLRLDHEAVG